MNRTNIYENNMESVLYVFFDSVSATELTPLLEEADLRDLRCGDTKIISRKVADNINRHNKTIFTEMYRSKLCRYAVSVAAVLILAVSCILLLNNDTVYAALTRFFSFIPGVGVVEVDDESNFNRQYILCETLPSVGDDKLYVEVKNATAVDGKLEVIYYTQLIAIPEIEINILANSPQEMDSDITDLIELYKKYGYDHYFTILEQGENGRYDLLRPISELCGEGEQLVLIEEYITDTEDHAYRRFACRQTYDITEITLTPDTLFTLSIGDIEVSFSLTPIQYYETEQEAVVDGNVCTLNGISVMCVPTWTEKYLYIDMYTLDSGEYDQLVEYFGSSVRYPCAVINGKVIGGSYDSGYIPQDTNSDRIGGRIVFDLQDLDEEITTAVIHVFGFIGLRSSDSISISFDSSLAITDIKINADLDFIVDEIKIVNGRVEMHFQHAASDQLDIDKIINIIEFNGIPLSAYCFYYDGESDIIEFWPDEILEENRIDFKGINYLIPGEYQYVILQKDGVELPEVHIPDEREILKKSCDEALDKIYQEYSYLQYLPKCEYGLYFHPVKNEDSIELWFDDVSYEDAAAYCTTLPGFEKDSYTDGIYRAQGRIAEHDIEWEIILSYNDMMLRVYQNN